MSERAEARLNLSKATVLLLQNNQTELDILGQVFIGFGVKAIRKCLTLGDADSVRYGVHAMELLVNALLAKGARRERLEGKLFGGARLINGLTDVGEMNATFAENFLRDEGLNYVGGSLRGDAGRRIQFWPVSGRARQVFLPKDTSEVFARETRPAPKPAADTGALELF